MEGKPRVSVSELIQWISSMNGFSYESIEDFEDGSAYGILLNVLYPGIIDVDSLQKKCIAKTEMQKNFNIIVQGVASFNLAYEIEPVKLITGHLLSHLKFMNWLYSLYLEKQYEKSKNLKFENSEDQLRTTDEYDPTSNSPSANLAQSEGIENDDDTNEINDAPAQLQALNECQETIAKLKHRCQSRLELQSNFCKTLEEIEKQRDFYHNKLFDIQTLIEEKYPNTRIGTHILRLVEEWPSDF